MITLTIISYHVSMVHVAIHVLHYFLSIFIYLDSSHVDTIRRDSQESSDGTSCHSHQSHTPTPTDPSECGPPSLFSKFSCLQLSTSQLVVLMETESCDACPAIQGSINTITASLNVNSKEGRIICGIMIGYLGI